MEKFLFIELLAAVLTFKFATVLSIIILEIFALHFIGELIYIFKQSKK